MFISIALPHLWICCLAINLWWWSCLERLTPFVCCTTLLPAWLRPWITLTPHLQPPNLPSLRPSQGILKFLWGVLNSHIFGIVTQMLDSPSLEANLHSEVYSVEKPLLVCSSCIRQLDINMHLTPPTGITFPKWAPCPEVPIASDEWAAPNQQVWKLSAICDFRDRMPSKDVDDMTRLHGIETPNCILPFLFMRHLPSPIQHALSSFPVKDLQVFGQEAGHLMADHNSGYSGWLQLPGCPQHSASSHCSSGVPRKLPPSGQPSTVLKEA